MSPKDPLPDSFGRDLILPQADGAREPLVGIVIVNSNAFEHTARCIECIRGLRYRNYFIVVVDNNSNDGSGFKLQRKLEDGKTFVILSPENRGFAAGCNFGIRFAQIREADFIWLLKAESRVEPDSLRPLVMQAERYPGAGAFASKVLVAPSSGISVKIEGRPPIRGAAIRSAGGKIDFSRQVVVRVGAGELDQGQYDLPEECEHVPGGAFFVRTSVIDDVGYFPEEYFRHFEEAEWCLRLRRRGYSLRFAPESVVWSFSGKGESAENPECLLPPVDPVDAYYQERNRRRFWFRHGTFFQRLGLFAKTILIDIPRTYRAGRRAPDVLARAVSRAQIRGATDFLFGRFGKR